MIKIKEEIALAAIKQLAGDESIEWTFSAEVVGDNLGSAEIYYTVITEAPTFNARIKCIIDYPSMESADILLRIVFDDDTEGGDTTEVLQCSVSESAVYSFTEEDICLLIQSIWDRSSAYSDCIQDINYYYGDNSVYSVIVELTSDGIIEWDETETVSFHNCDGEVEKIEHVYSSEFEEDFFKYVYYERLIDDCDLDDTPILRITNDHIEICVYIEDDSDLKALICGNDSNEIGIIDIEDIVIRTNHMACIESGHPLTEVNATVPVFIPNQNRLIDEKINVFYCFYCNRYYVLEEEYQRVRCIGMLFCRVIEAESFKGGRYRNWEKTSIITDYGYNVREGVWTIEERRGILDLLIENKIVTKEEIINHLQFLIADRIEQPRMKKAIEKWTADVDYLQERVTSKRNIRVGKMYRKTR